MRVSERKVLFVCVGNSCRSQMAQGFAAAYGKDVLEAQSAGLAPASGVSGLTRKVMLEKNIKLDRHFPKALSEVGISGFDLVVNMSGYELPGNASVPVREWKVEDPIGAKEEVYCKVRDQIEQLVMGLILEFRRERNRGKKTDV
jgi:arsenate reductase (thioredoxin)